MNYLTLENVFSDRHVNCVRPFTFSNEVLCQHILRFLQCPHYLVAKQMGFSVPGLHSSCLLLWEKRKSLFCASGCQDTFWLKKHKLTAEPKKKKKKKKRELKEVLKVMTNNLYLCNLFHQCSSPPYTRKKNWLCFITKTIWNTTLSPLLQSWGCYSFCKECMKKYQNSCTERVS